MPASTPALRCHYEVLGAARDADEDELKKARDKLTDATNGLAKQQQKDEQAVTTQRGQATPTQQGQATQGQAKPAQSQATQGKAYPAKPEGQSTNEISQQQALLAAYKRA